MRLELAGISARTSKFLVVCLLPLLFLPGCKGDQDIPLKTLPSGLQVRVIGIHIVKMGEKVTGLILEYRTDLEFEDTLSFKKEVDGIWNYFRSDVERTGYSNAMISANEGPRGFLFRHNRTLYFYFKKDSAGIWKKSAAVNMP